MNMKSNDMIWYDTWYDMIIERKEGKKENCENKSINQNKQWN